MRVAHVDMTNATHRCPGNFVELISEEAPRRLCVPHSEAKGCFAHVFPVVGPQFSSVCGKIIGYQNRTTNAFFPFFVDRSLTIDDVYLDGISLTHGSNPRLHIWTLAAALDETRGHSSGCRCSNILVNSSATVPNFVGDDYFCDTGSEEAVQFKFYPNDPLWDGEGCGDTNACCSFNNPPWFFRELASPTRDGIELRVCRDASTVNENIPFEVVELYVR